MYWVVLIVACESTPIEVAPVRATIPALQGDEVIDAAPLIQTARSAPPAWVDGPLPTDPWSLPVPHGPALTDRVCAGVDLALLERVTAQIDIEAAAEPNRWGPWALSLLNDCSTPGRGFCEQARQIAEQSGDGPADQVVWHAAGACAHPSTAEWLGHDGVIADAIVDWLSAQDNVWRPARWDDLATLAAPLLRPGNSHRDKALQALGAYDDEANARLLLRHGQSLDVEARDEVWFWLYRQSLEPARVAFADACSRNPSRWQCVEGDAPLDRLDEAVRAPDTDLSELLARYPGHRSALVSSLLECVREGASGTGAKGYSCLSALAGAGEDEAVRELLQGFDSLELSSGWAATRTAWIAHGSSEGIRDHLIALGALPEGAQALNPDQPPPNVARWLISQERGRGRTDTSPGQMLRAVLHRVPELADVILVQRDPIWRQQRDHKPRHHELLAWMDGQRYRALYPSMGGHDGQWVGMLNALAERRQLEVRFVHVSPGDAVVWGPEAVLRGLVDEGLLPVEPRPVVAADEPSDTGYASGQDR